MEVPVRNRLNKLLQDNRKASARRFDVLAKDGTDEAEVFLYDAIVSNEEEAAWWGGVAPESFVKALREIDASTIHLRINSPGGSVFAARAMEQALRDHKAKIIVHIDGLAASAATFIALAGDEIVMGKGALFMIHKAWTGMWGNADDLRAEADLLDKIDGTLADTYAERTGADTKRIADWMSAETWFTADEAVEHGFADRVAETEAKAKAWNLSAYANAPKPEPEPPQTPAPAANVEPDPTAAPNPTPYATDEHRARQAQRMRLVAQI
ncbi:ATP-dependent Clp protease proteolytic subunit [Cupriavidus metallidurans]|jgi:ATP-dependent Clp protease protease subunit|nr:ATP-dependent Clp protease proteolytic subunit [Cupriavidus metallidurans]